MHVRSFERGLSILLCVTIILSPAHLLAAEENPSGAPAFEDMVFDVDVLGVELRGTTYRVALSGIVRVAADGSPEGRVTALYGGGRTAVISLDPSPGLSIDLGGTSPEADLRFASDLGQEPDAAFERFSAQLDAGAEVDTWNDEAQARLVFLALAQSDAWGRNLKAAKALMGAGTGAPIVGGFWCNVSANSLATLVAAALALGCAAALVPCASATAITFGSFAVPCAYLESLCVGGVFAGLGATRKAMKKLLHC